MQEFHPKARRFLRSSRASRWSDQWSFWQHGYRGISDYRHRTISLSTLSHAATDTPDKLDYDRFALVVSGMEKVIEELDKL